MLSLSQRVILRTVVPTDLLISYLAGKTSNIKEIVRTGNNDNEVKFYTGDKNQNLYVVEEGFNKSTLYAVTNPEDPKKLGDIMICDRCNRPFAGEYLGKPLSIIETFGSKKMRATVDKFCCHPKCVYGLIKRENPSEENNKQLMFLQRIC